MFYANFLNLCAERKESPSGVAKKIGLSNAAANGWKNGKMPSDVTLAKLAQHFGVTTDYLLTGEQKEKAPTQEDERKITFDDFTYAMQNESKDLTEMDKQILLSMAKQLSNARKKKDGQSG